MRPGECAGVGNPRPRRFRGQPEIRIPKPSTRNPKPRANCSNPEALDCRPEALKPTPGTLSHGPYRPHSTPLSRPRQETRNSLFKKILNFGTVHALYTALQDPYGSPQNPHSRPTESHAKDADKDLESHDTHRLLSSSFLWFIFRILQGSPKKELLRSRWVELKPSFLAPCSRPTAPTGDGLRRFGVRRRPASCT